MIRIIVNTAIPEETSETVRGWVLYDGECPLCAGTATRFAPFLRRHHFNLAPLQTPWVQQKLGLKTDEPLTEMKLLAGDGRIFGGAEAWAVLFRSVWWLWPLGCLLTMPGLRWLAGCIYRWIARNRQYPADRCVKKDQRPVCHRHAAFFELP